MRLTPPNTFKRLMPRGLANPRAVHVLLKLKQNVEHSIMVFIETKAGNRLMENLRIKLGYNKVSGGVGGSLWEIVRYMEDFQLALNECELDDLGYVRLAFTRSNKLEGDTFVHERRSSVRGQHYRRFHFESCWAVIEDYKNLVEASWLVALQSVTVVKVMDCVQPKLSEQLRIFLDRPFTTEEIKRAAFDMSPTKARGLDGLPALFYHKFWDKVGSSISEAFLKCLNDGDSLTSVNDTLICLIPKTQVVVWITEYRPISLCNVMYTIVMKAMANQLCVVLGEVISETHSALFPGRIISDNAIIGFERIHAL
ncbi:hypothetical protein Dsin_002450 [Dipteronia sinensis]|uniref:Reverse transcriptase n=1 Tax=Dipteronia sinensis TaxID=43782 RepID=A0AAE0B7I5_9ROSI|nr:hypothetical protein Dsin_002450 [Dipteronia sinensis]